MKKRTDVEYRITVLLGIVQQLQTTRQTTMLKAFDMTRSQYSVLSHFALHPERQCTISELADVMEINQPGVTKIVKKLVERGLLNTIELRDDKRKKQLAITEAGLDFVKRGQEMIAPDNAYCFEQWSDEELSGFSGSLDKLKCWLDDHRDDIRTDG